MVKYSGAEQDAEFVRLVQEVKACKKCARMCGSERVLSHASGSLSAKVMFIGEAPGRLGANLSKIPFHGDQAGHNFESLLEGAGISRYESFVTNAVLCNPKDDKGNNSPPTKQEIELCSGFLKRQIEIIQPELVVTLGGTALKATSKVEGHDLDLLSSVRTVKPWYGRKLSPLYHPGQRAMIHRSFANQLVDYNFIAETLNKKKQDLAHSARKITKSKTIAVISEILKRKPRLTYFSLHKLFFLIENESIARTGARITDCYIIRQRDGPYCVDLHIGKIKKTFPMVKWESQKNKLYAFLPTADLFSGADVKDLSEEQLNVISAVVTRYGAMSDAELKKCTYLTSEMRKLLRWEHRSGLAMINSPLLQQIPIDTRSIKVGDVLV